MDLQSLINVVGKKGKRNAIVLSSQHTDYDDLRVNDLYQGLKTNKYKDEKTAAEKILKSDPSDKNYIKLRTKLKDSLFHNLFFLNYDNSKHPEYAQVEYEVRKNILQAKILLREGNKENAVWLIKRTIKIAEPYFFTEELLECYTLLRNQISYSGNISKFETIHSEVVKLEEIHSAEREASYLQYASMGNILKSLVNKRRFIPKFKKWTQKAEQLRKKHNTPYLNLTEFRLKSNYYTLIEDYDELLKACNQAEKYIQNNGQKAFQTKITEIALYKGHALLNLKDFKNGKKFFDSSIKKFNKDNNNWFALMEDYFLLCMRTDNFKQAGKIIDQVKANVFYRAQAERARDRWYIYQGYYAFVNPDHKPKFQIQNFLQQIPDFDKDKYGYQASTLIIHFFHLLKDNDYEGLQVRIEVMKKYIMKQIARSGNERLQCLLRLLQNAHSTGYNYKLTVEKSQNYLKKLKNFKGKAEAFEEIEVIEYERLWEILLEMLKTRNASYLIVS